MSIKPLLTSSSTITNAYGLYSSAEADSFLGATAAITNAYGLYSTVTANAVVVGTSTITNAYGIYSQVGAEELLGNANITNAYNLYLDNYSTSWGGNLGDITNNYALYIEEPTLGSTNYALYSAGGTNYFGGNVGIGTTTPNWLTQIAGTRPTLTLSDTSAATNNKHWLFSSMGGNLYIGTSTDSYATSTPAALTILNNGNIGIGTSSPGQVLAVAGSIYSGSGGFILPDGTIIDGVGDLGKWATSGSNIYYNTGNVGIGTSTPNWLTQIAGTRPSLALSDTSATANNKHWLFSSMGGSLYIGTSTDSYATSTPSALTILNNGNVGIGTSSPGQVLAVAGSIYSGSGGFILPDGTVVDELGDLGKWTTTGSDIYYTTGNVGIGTTTPNWKLQIAGTRPSLTLSDTSASANNKHWLFSSMGGSLYIGTSTDSYGTSTPSALTILNNGNIGIGTSSPSQRFSVSGSIYTDTSFIFPDGTIQTSAASPGFSSSGGLTILSTVTDKVGIGSTSPTATLSIQSQGGQTTDIFAIASSSQSNYLSVSATGLTTASNFVTNSLVFTSSSTAYSTLTSYGGFNGYINASGGFGTGGNDSVLNAERITAYGNLVNIGSIQAGQIKLTTGGTFAADVAYGAGSGPYSVAIGDLNSDSKADLAVVNNSASNVSILLNNGDGTFAADVLYGIGTDSTGVAISDLNGDGKADLAISNWSDDNVSVLLNSGDGTFAADVLYDVGSGPQSIAIGDLNGDGKIDLAVANTGGNVSVLLNNGDGTFAAVVPYGAGTTPFSVAIGDLNGDGKADLAVANNSSANISVLLNKGDGTFAADVLYGAETNPQSIAIGDLNGDGEADLAVANYNSNNVSVLLNNGDGTFAADVLYGAGTNPRYIAIGDLNGDGEADLAVANGTTANVSVLLNNGDGTFAAGVLYGAGTNPRSIAIGNLNSDGKLDLAVANNGANVSVLLNNANPLFYAGKIGGYSATTSLGAIGIGTTTPNWLTQIAGTRPTLTLSDTSAGTNLKHWLFSSMGGNLYIGTSTDSYATSTPAALTILNGGNIGIGAASPGTMLQIGNDSSVLSGFFDVTAKGFAILPNVDYARFLIEGNSDATITLIDQGGTANNRSFMIQTDGTATKFRSIKDDTTAQKDTLMTFNHSTGYVGIGIADASTLLHIGSQSSVVSGIFDASTQGLAILPNIDYARLLVEGNTDATITLVDRGGTANNRAFMIQTDGTSTKFRSIQDNTLAQADNIMVFNHTSGNVGIGTTDPDQLLDVRGSIVQGRNAESAFSRSIGISDYVGDAATTISGMRIENEADGDTVLHFQTGEWGVQGPTPRMTILETGNVGIGTESPTTPLHIYEANATTNSIVDMLHFQLISTGAVANGFGSGIKWTMEDADDAAGEEQGRINLLFTDKTAASEDTAMTFTVQKAGRLTETMRLVSGHVGIGSTTPYAPLSIASTTNILEDLFVIATSTVAGNTNTVFKVDSYGNYHYDGSATTPAADYAEYYFTIDTDLESGEVVCVDIERENAVKRCTRQADPNIMGIVSTKPAIVGNSKTSYINNPKYKIIGMLGQVPAKVSTENGAIRPGDSLTSASIPGYLMRSGAGDPTVGVALEGVPGNDAFGPLARSDRYINVLISRRNKSITVEEVEDKITDRIAAMEIEDEVNILISDAIDNLNLNDEITVVVDPKLLMLSTKLTVTTNDLGTRISNTEDQLYVISNKLLDLNAGLGQVRDNVNEITNNQSSISKQLSIINKQLENIYIDGEGNIKLGQSVSTSTAVAVVEITTKEDNTNTALVINQVGNGDIADFQKNKVSVVNISSQGKVSIVGELMVDGRIMACAGGSCGQALNNAVDETMGDLGVEGKVVAGAYEGYCDNGFIWVPGSSKYGTMPGFCVMKTKAGKDSDNKIVARDPIATLQDDSSVWTEISQGEAELACQNLGLEYHLISDNEWLTIAENIIKVSANDIDLEAEGLQLAIADSEYILTNDNSIYEFSSTVAEWTSQIVTKKGCLEMATQDEWQEYAEVIDYRGFDIAPPYYLNHKENNIGKIKIGDNDDNLRGFVRGLNGIYSIDLSNTPTTKNDEIGFRCAR